MGVREGTNLAGCSWIFQGKRVKLGISERPSEEVWLEPEARASRTRSQVLLPRSFASGRARGSQTSLWEDPRPKVPSMPALLLLWGNQGWTGAISGLPHSISNIKEIRNKHSIFQELVYIRVHHHGEKNHVVILKDYHEYYRNTGKMLLTC